MHLDYDEGVHDEIREHVEFCRKSVGKLGKPRQPLACLEHCIAAAGTCLYSEPPLDVPPLPLIPLTGYRPV